MPTAPFIPVIPAGGAGTRLWPLSRRDRPKFLLDLTGAGRSLLQQTVDRLAPLADCPPIVVTGAAHAAAVGEQVQGRARVLGEPEPRNSMPAIALAAAFVEREEPTAVIGSFAADHLIGDTAAFAEAVAAARGAAELGYLVTLGVTPTHPATGFGYIEQSARPGSTALTTTGARPVARFVEKPDPVRAEQFLATGRFFWNAGMFIARVDVLLDALAEQLPPLAAGVRAIAAASGSAEYEQVLAQTWPRLTAIAIDHALAEPLAADGRVAVVPAGFDWDDVGDFEALARQLRTAEGGTSRDSVRRADGADSARRVDSAASAGGDASDVQVVGPGTVQAVSSRATVYGSTHRHVALVGLEGISVVDTEDVLLVLADGRAQDLAALVRGLDESGHGHLR